MPSESGFSPVPLRSSTTAILGAGAWGTALSHLIRHNGHPYLLWSRQTDLSLETIALRSSIIVSAVSMNGVRTTIEALKTIGLPPETIVVSATKGLDGDTLKTPSVLWQTAFPQNRVVVLSGPNLSQEIMDGLPAATVAASEALESAAAVQQVFSSDRFRVYTNTDPLGTELGGTLKNVIAIAVGVCDGLNLGTNAKSALMTRALTEIIRVGTHLGGQRQTFFGLSGLGDMLATCSSVLSRNYRVGYGLAQGRSLSQVLTDLHSTAEGVNTANVLMRLAEQEGISIPISLQVYRLLNGHITPQEAVDSLVRRDLKSEGL